VARAFLADGKYDQARVELQVAIFLFSLLLSSLELSDTQSL